MPSPFLSVVIPTFNDYRGLSMTVQSLGLNHDRRFFEVVVLDNYCKCEDTKKFCLENVDRYVEDVSSQGTCYAKNAGIYRAHGEFCLVIDSHVNLACGAINRLIKLLSQTPEAEHNIYHGFLVDSRGKVQATELKPIWSKGMWGKWHNRFETPEEEAAVVEPFEIWGHGGAVFCVNRRRWHGFHKDAKGFGGEEGAIQEIYRSRGGKALCLPFLRWTHSFNNGKTVPHPIWVDDKLRNYLLNFSLLPSPETRWADCLNHFSNLLSFDKIRTICSEVLPADCWFEHSVKLGRK